MKTNYSPNCRIIKSGNSKVIDGYESVIVNLLSRVVVLMIEPFSLIQFIRWVNSKVIGTYGYPNDVNLIFLYEMKG